MKAAFTTLDEFAHLLKQLRKEHGWTQDELASRAGIAAKQISRIENAVMEPKLSTVLRLASALGVTLSVVSRGGDTAPTIESIF